jgi:signal transduction histidine kinase
LPISTVTIAESIGRGVRMSVRAGAGWPRDLRGASVRPEELGTFGGAACGSVVALPGEASPVGAIGLGAAEPLELAAADMAFLGDLARVAGAAIERRRRDSCDRTEAIERLAAGVAHDLGNLLGAVRNFAELLAVELPPDGRAAADTAQIQLAAREGIALAELLRVIAGDRLDAPESVRIAPALAGLGDSVPPNIRVVGPADPVAAVRVGRAALAEILDGVVSNAVDAMPEGGTLSVAVDTLGADAVLVTITDTGTGIAPDVATRAIDPYFTTKPIGEGKGLGLAVAAGIVRGLGGTLSVEPAPERGTAIRILLPSGTGV